MHLQTWIPRILQGRNNKKNAKHCKSKKIPKRKITTPEDKTTYCKQNTRQKQGVSDSTNAHEYKTKTTSYQEAQHIANHEDFIEDTPLRKNDETTENKTVDTSTEKNTEEFLEFGSTPDSIKAAESLLAKIRCKHSDPEKPVWEETRIKFDSSSDKGEAKEYDIYGNLLITKKDIETLLKGVKDTDGYCITAGVMIGLIPELKYKSEAMFVLWTVIAYLANYCSEDIKTVGSIVKLLNEHVPSYGDKPYLFSNEDRLDLIMRDSPISPEIKNLYNNAKKLDYFTECVVDMRGKIAKCFDIPATNDEAVEVANKHHINTLAEKTDPLKIKAFLDKKIIGQEDVKRSLSVVLSNHLKAFYENKQAPRQTMLIIGPTGSGKTEVSKTLCQYADLPIEIVDMTQITAEGWRGLDKSEIFKSLHKQAEKKKAEYGIVVLDEFDKFCRGDAIEYGRIDQKSILGMLDGIPVRDTSRDSDGTAYETKNNLFILTGSFEDMKRLEHMEKQIGFDEHKGISSEKTIRERLEKFGIYKEIVGRITGIVFTETLTTEEVVRALVDADESFVKSYEELVRLYGKELVIEEQVIRKAISDSFREGLGVRGARNRLDEILRDAIYNACENNEKEVVLE